MFTKAGVIAVSMAFVVVAGVVATDLVRVMWVANVGDETFVLAFRASVDVAVFYFAMRFIKANGGGDDGNE